MAGQNDGKRTAPRSDPRRLWVLLIAGLIALLVLALLVAALGRAVVGALNPAFGNAGEPDPMFAEPAETVTRPPALAGEEDESDGERPDDPSRYWHYETITPLTEDGYAVE